MTFTTIGLLSWLAIAIALGVATHSLIRLSRLPVSRDHRPIAPAAALAMAYGLLKLQTVVGVPELMPGVRELAWQFWEIAMLIEVWFLVHMYTKCRSTCTPRRLMPPATED